MLASVLKLIRSLVKQTFSSGGMFPQQRDLYPPYLKGEEITRHIQTQYYLSEGVCSYYIKKLQESQLDLGLELIIKNMFFLGRSTMSSE